MIVMISIRAIYTGCVWISPNNFNQKLYDNGELFFLWDNVLLKKIFEFIHVIFLSETFIYHKFYKFE